MDQWRNTEEITGARDTHAARRRAKNTLEENMAEAAAELADDKMRTKALEKAAAYLSHGLRTERQMREYLARKEYPDEVIAYCLEKLRSYNYINDHNYAEEYLRCCGAAKGSVRLKVELIKKGVPKDIVTGAIAAMEGQDEAVSRLAEKYMEHRDHDRKNKARLYRYLYARGFSYAEIQSAVDAMFADTDEF